MAPVYGIDSVLNTEQLKIRFFLRVLRRRSGLGTALAGVRLQEREAEKIVARRNGGEQEECGHQDADQAPSARRSSGGQMPPLAIGQEPEGEHTDSRP